MAYLTEIDPETGMIDAALLRGKGTELQQSYNAAEPFPHIVIDDFMQPKILEMCLGEFTNTQHDQRSFDRDQERFKREFKPDLMSQPPRNLFYTFNSRPFIPGMSRQSLRAAPCGRSPKPVRNSISSSSSRLTRADTY